MSALFSRLKTWVSGEILTANDLNAEFNNILNNIAAEQISGASSDVSQMQVTTDPGEVGSESLSSEIRGEIRRLRFLIKEITGKTQWYETPASDIATLLAKFPVQTADIGDLQVTEGKIAANAVTNSKMADNSVGTAELINLNVTSDKLAAAAVISGKIAMNAISTGNIINNAVTNDKIQSVNGGKIDVVSISAAKLIANTSYLSNSCSNFSVATTLLTDVTNLTVTVSFPYNNRFFIAKLVDDGTTNPSYVETSGGTTSDFCYLYLYRGAVLIDTLKIPNGALKTPVSAISFLVDSSTYTASDVLQLKVKQTNSGMTTLIYNAKLLVVEV